MSLVVNVIGFSSLDVAHQAPLLIFPTKSCLTYAFLEDLEEPPTANPSEITFIFTNYSLRRSSLSLLQSLSSGSIFSLTLSWSMIISLIRFEMLIFKSTRFSSEWLFNPDSNKSSKISLLDKGFYLSFQMDTFIGIVAMIIMKTS